MADAATNQHLHSEWTLLSNHGHVLVCLATDRNARVIDIAALVGLTARAVQNILGDLVTGGMITRVKVGRRNAYEIVGTSGLRHSLEQQHTINELLAAVGPIAAHN